MSQFLSPPLRARLSLAFGADVSDDPDSWTWTDVSEDWDTATDLTLKDGASNGSSGFEAAECTWLLVNDDGRYTPEDPRSPHWPHVVEGTPVWWELDAGAGYVDWFTGFIATITPTWPGRNRRMCRAKIVAFGAFGRIQVGEEPLRPALERAILASDPLAAWWLTDGPESTAYTAIGSGSALQALTARPTPAEFAGPAGAPDPVPLLIKEGAYTGQLDASVVGGSSDEWSVVLIAHLQGTDTDTENSNWEPIRWFTTGTFAEGNIPGQWSFFQDWDYQTRTLAGGVFINSSGDISDYVAGRWMHLRLSARQVGGTAEASAWINGELLITGSAVGKTIGAITGIRLGDSPGLDFYRYQPIEADRATESAAVAAIAIYNTYDIGDQAEAMLAYVGELASDRVERLCGEAGVPVEIVAGDSEAMGPQAPETLSNLLRETQATDGGRLEEYRWGFRWRPLTDLLNQSAAFILDGQARELHEPFSPTRDLTRLRNRWDVSRRGGGSARYDDVEHQQRGVFADSIQINPASDDRLIHHAAWRTGLTTAPGLRYPALGIDLATDRHLIPGWQALHLGDRVQVENLVEQHPPGGVDQILEGRQQVIRGRHSWRAAVITSPAAPYTVGILDDADLGRLEADYSTLAVELPRGQASGTFTVAIGADALWTTDPAEFPMVIIVGGEHVRISAISGASTTQTFTLADRGLNGFTRAWPAGTRVRVRDAFRLAL